MDKNKSLKLLAADPYYFNDSKHFDKAGFIDKSAQVLMQCFGKSEVEVYAASKSFIGREEHLFNFISSINFWENSVKVQLTEQSTNLSTLVSIFALEAITRATPGGKEDRFRSFLLQYLTKEEKIELLSRYTFGNPYPLGEGRFRKKHLCYRAAVLTKHGQLYKGEYCTSGANPLCTCRDWLNTEANEKKINHYMNMFCTYIYQMRNSVVHDASFVQFTSMPWQDKDLGTIVPATSDAYSQNQKKTFTSYETEITVHRWHEILRLAAWRAFENGSRLKHTKKVRLLKQL